MKSPKPTYEELEQRVAELEAQKKNWQWFENRDNSEHREAIAYRPFYGDITEINTERIILDNVEKENLIALASDITEWLDISIAIFEINGDYAYRQIAPGWCRLMNAASRKQCSTTDNSAALNSGKWICHENSWKDAAKRAIETNDLVKITCVGGMQIVAEPINVKNKIVGAITVGYGKPPTETGQIKKISEAFDIETELLKKTAKNHIQPPEYITKIAKKRQISVAKIIGEIVNRKQIEKALAENREELKEQLNFTKTLMDSLPIPVFYKDKNGKYISCNRAFEKFTGRTRSEIINKTVFDLWNLKQAREYRKRDVELLNQNPVKPQRYEFEVVDAQNNIRNVIFYKAVFTDQHGKPAGIIGAYLDITD